MLLQVTMPTRWSIRRFFDRPDSSPRRICTKDAMFCRFIVLNDSSTVLIHRSGGSVQEMQYSVFLRDSLADIKCFFTLRWPFDWVFDDSSIALIRRPGGFFPIMRCFIFLRGSWFMIGSSWFFVPEDLSQWLDVPYFCEDIDFWLGCPDSSSRKICPSD